MLKSISRKELIRRLNEFGFVGPYSGGKHQFMVKGSLKLHIPNPHMSDISSYLLKEILKQAGIKPKDF